MTLPTYSFDQIVEQQQAVMNNISAQLLNFDPGSVLLALVQANAANSMWLQAIATSLLAVTRLSTSSGNDVDTFIQDFGFQRLQGAPASGAVTFSRLSTGIQGVIPVGTVVSVPGVNNLTFTVTVPPSGASYPAYDAASASYIITSSNLNCLAPVTCNQVGTIGNVNASAISIINNSLVGVTNVSNASAFTNGVNTWSDAETKVQFILYIQSLSRATQAAINYAISQVPNIQRWIIIENEDTSGNTDLGFFYAVVDFGGGNATMQQIADVSAQINLYRGFTIQYTVIAPVTTTANISVNVHLVSNPTETQAQITANIQAAITNYINSLAFEETLFISKIVELTYDADPNIANVIVYPTSGYATINGSAADLTLSLPKDVIIPGTISVTYV